MKILRLAMVLLIILGNLSGLIANAAPQTKATAAILMDAKTGEVLYEKNIHHQNAPASTTKIMTAILAIESGRLEDLVTVSQRAAATRGSTMNLYAGQVLTLRELLTGLMLRSGNDAAVAIAEHIAGSEEAFVSLMNHKAQQLGAQHTHFHNPHGLTASGHYSSAFDLAWIARYALSNPVFADLVSTKETNIEWLDRRGKESDKSLRNTNKLLWMLEDADGVKTGTTGEAGPCLVSSATRGGQKLIAVVLHDHSRWYDSMQLLKYGFDTYELYSFANQGEVVTTLGVDNGLTDEVSAIIAQPGVIVTLADDYPHTTVEIDLPEKIKAPVYKGQKLGELTFYIRDKAVKTIDIVAASDVEERTIARMIVNNLLFVFRVMSRWGLF